MTKAVMTIHGYLSSIEDFEVLYGYLDGYDHVHKCEIPGHNGEVDFDLFTVDSVLAKVLGDYDKLANQYDVVDVVGFSMGGALTSYLCAMRRVHRAVMIAPSNKYISLSALLKWAVHLTKEYTTPIKESSGTLIDRFRFANDHTRKDRDNLGELVESANNFVEKVSIGNFAVFRKLMIICNDRVALQGGTVKIDTPVLLMIGSLDELVPYKSVEFVQQYFEDMTVCVIEGIGHSLLSSSYADKASTMAVNHLLQGDS